jgi:hypothetical protein
MNRFALLTAALLLGAAGCASEPPQLRVEPSSYYTYGYYIGSTQNVKLFVEDLTFVEEQKGTLAAEIAILNERPRPITFLLSQNQLAVGGRRVLAQESQSIIIAPGRIGRATLQFRTDLSGFDRGTLEIDGVQVELGTRLHFSVPIYAASPGAPEPTLEPGHGMHKH